MAKRAGVTEKISVSVNRDDMAIIRKRAKRLYGGNVSAVIAEVIARAKAQEQLSDLLDWLGGPAPMSKEVEEEIDRELAGQRRKRRTRAA
ncbi:MAG: hypothetical protein HYV09_37440 [Deltaproteobacteria bacterium]|nr:hypothetical protein [Deltaproteobacteria bacterium]